MKPPKNSVCLWYNNDAEEAANFYAQTFPDSQVLEVNRAPSDYPSGKEGDVIVVWFTVMGHYVHGTERWPHVQAQRSLLVPGVHRRPGGDRPILERHRRQRRRGEHVRLVQGQVGDLLADHAAGACRSPRRP